MRDAATEKYIYPVYIYIQKVYKKDNKNNTWSRDKCVMLLRRNIYTPYIYQQEVYKKDNKNNTWQGEMRDAATEKYIYPVYISTRGLQEIQQK